MDIPLKGDRFRVAIYKSPADKVRLLITSKDVRGNGLLIRADMFGTLEEELEWSVPTYFDNNEGFLWVAEWEVLRESSATGGIMIKSIKEIKAKA